MDPNPKRFQALTDANNFKIVNRTTDVLRTNREASHSILVIDENRRALTKDIDIGVYKIFFFESKPVSVSVVATFEVVGSSESKFPPP